MRKIAEVNYPDQKTIKVLLWNNGDGFTVRPGDNRAERDFDTEAEVVEFCRAEGIVKHVAIYPDLEGRSIAAALLPGEHHNVLTDGCTSNNYETELPFDRG